MNFWGQWNNGRENKPIVALIKAWIHQSVTGYLKFVKHCHVLQLIAIQIKTEIKHELEHVNIQHATLEFETEDENCIDTNAY